MPIRTAFTGRGYSATFIEDLAAQIAKLDTAAGTEYGGLNKQVNSTRGLSLLVRKGVSLVRDLDDLLSRQLRKTDRRRTRNGSGRCISARGRRRNR